ncbi:MAG: hypothetical protein JO335_02450 [Sphingomonas sp.]|nr:hypothetical protein [Sphingomonas sp.]
MRRLLILLACLALTACWYGDRLYTPSDARPAIRPGVYRATAEDEAPKAYRISIEPDGMTKLDGGETTDLMGFSPLDSVRGTYVAWLPLKDKEPDERGELQIYLLMMRAGPDEYRIYPPECKDSGADLARKNGATVEEGTSPACYFTSRSDVEKALRSLPLDEHSASTLKRIP